MNQSVEWLYFNALYRVRFQVNLIQTYYFQHHLPCEQCMRWIASYGFWSRESSGDIILCSLYPIRIKHKHGNECGANMIEKTIRIWDANSWWFQSFIGEWNQWEHWIAYEIREWRWTRIMLTSQPHWMVWITMRSNMHGTGWTLIAMFSLQSMINSMRAGWLNHDEDVDYEFRSSWWFQCEQHDNNKRPAG